EALQLESRISPDFPPIYADHERVRQVLENLLSNAIKYSPEGGVVRVGARVEGEYAVVSVSDQGIGIPAEEQQLIFRRFYRVDNRLRRNTQGAGLGLFLSHALVEAGGGRIWVESTPGRGSRFLFSVPLATPRLVDVAAAEPQVTGKLLEG
ncbi:MAG: histidine kinase, partial [Roseiflexaceae bacterium]|nr:histidine kinase [Roseiflexaceae bacterium]